MGLISEIDRSNLTQEELFLYLHDDEGLPVTRNGLKQAVLRREILPTRIGNGNYFSRRDGLDWIASRKQAGVYAAAAYAGQRD